MNHRLTKPVSCRDPWKPATENVKEPPPTHPSICARCGQPYWLFPSLQKDDPFRASEDRSGGALSQFSLLAIPSGTKGRY